MAIAFERATEIVARQLASFRLGDVADPFAYNDHEKLCAGHIVGSLWTNGLLNTGDEKWVPVETETNASHIHGGQCRHGIELAVHCRECADDFLNVNQHPA